MSDPERLLHGSAGALSARLLRAGHDEGPSRRSFERTLAAVGVATTTLGAAGTAGALGAAGKATTLTLLGAAKWAGMGVAGGVLVSLAAHGLETRTAAPRAAANVVATVPEARAKNPEAAARAPHATEMAALPQGNVDSPAPSAAPADPKAVRPSLAAPPRPAPFAGADDTTGVPLAAEVSFVDRARRVFQQGDAQGTLAALLSYEHEFPDRRLLPEVLLLRMEASKAAGDGSRARGLAQAIVRDYGKSPHAARARAVLGELSGEAR